MSEPVCRQRLHRHQAAEQLVLALGAAFEHLDAAADRELDRLVIAAFEVQQRHVLDRAPIAAIQGSGVPEKQGRGNRPALAFGQHHRQIPGHTFAEAQKKLQVEVGARAVCRIGRAVAAIEEFPMASLDRLALEPAQRDACLAYAAPLLANILAPRMAQPREELPEVPVALVPPVKLDRAPQSMPCACMRLASSSRGKSTWREE